MSPMVASLGGLGAFGFGVFPGGALEPIATVTVGAGGTSSITFSNIPSGFQHLQIRALCMHSNGANGLYSLVDFNGTGSGWYFHRLSGDGNAATAGSGSGRQLGPHLSGSNSNTVPTAYVIDVLDYGSTSKTKVIRALVGADSNGLGEFTLSSLLWNNTSAVTSFSLQAYSQGSASSYAQYTTFALYGVRA